MIYTTPLYAQNSPAFTPLPSLPDEKGFAGMYAGVSKGILFCMGGANFPGLPPWQGGVKKWHNNIYQLANEKEWIPIHKKLPVNMAYGVSVTYGNEIILIGGSNETGHLNQVLGFTWTGDSAIIRSYPPLPVPLSNMTGAIIDHLIIIAGGNQFPGGPALKKCFCLNLQNTGAGWTELPAWPGEGRILPACAVFNSRFYLFSGERTGMHAGNKAFRQIFQDAYCFTPQHENGHCSGYWTMLPAMPKGVSAAGAPAPVLHGNCILLWGGVDSVTALNKDPQHHPGIPGELLAYYPATGEWKLLPPPENNAARVTLPIVHWSNKWVFINGEIKPGIRTNTVVAISDEQ